MKDSGLNESRAYEKVAETKLFKFLKNPKTGLLWGPVGYIEKAYDLKTKSSVDSMMRFIQMV